MVSVIIPNYNHAQYLKQRIGSVLGQSYRDFELIILDDCSTDNSSEIIEEYRNHKKVSHLLFNENNSGSTFKQWQKGIELAKGKYIWIAESDDWCEPTLLETLVWGLENDPECVLAYVQCYVVTGQSEITRISASNKMEQYVAGKEYVPQYLGNHNTIMNASMAIFKRECYFAVPQIYSSFKFCGDWLFWVHIALQGNVFISGKTLNYFRKHNDDVSGKMYATGNNFIEELRLLKLLKNDKLISDAEYKKYVLPRYIRYVVFKKQYDRAIRPVIEEAFFCDNKTSYRSFLVRNAFKELFKIKIRNRLKLQ